MEIAEVKEKKLELQKSILELCKQFTDETGINVDDIRVQKRTFDSKVMERSYVIYELEVVLERL